jgi:hypothetical protein
VSKSFAENAVLFCQRVQLLRIGPQLSQEAADPNIGAPSLVAHAMRAADGQPHLTGVLGWARAGRQHQRPAGDRLAMMLGISKADEQIPSRILLLTYRVNAHG